MPKFLCGVIFLLILVHGTLLAQPPNPAHDSIAGPDSLQRNCQPKDLVELIWKKPFPSANEEKWFNIIVIPFLGYTPATGLQFGAGASWSLKTSLGTNTRLSAGTVQAYYTVKKQLVTQIKTNIYTYKNRWFLQGDWRLYLFQQPTYGLGTTSQEFAPLPSDPPEAKVDSECHGKYPMKYNWLKFHEIFSRKITSGLYLGLGYHLDYHFDIDDEKLDVDSGVILTTPHYSYCMKYGFDPDHYISSGISLNLVYDTRDNIINPYKGIYVNANYRTNFTWLGSNKNGSLLWTEFRGYISLSKRLPRHLLAFWTYESFQLSGAIPYLDLMSNAFDQNNSSGRGYSQGRWRGQDFAYAEMEYRFPISQCTRILGGVVFVNVTSASDRDRNIPLLGYLKPAGGIGLRVMVSREDRTNISIDYAIGDGSKGFYFQVQEIF
jgi:outer membrane protein assembly factor BamA